MDRPVVISSYQCPGYNPLAFLDKHNIGWDIIKQSDIDFFSELYDLRDYQRLVIYGHDEYWTPNIRKKIEQAVRSGTHLVNFSGNTAFWGLSLDERKINSDRLGHTAKSAEFAPEWTLLRNYFGWAGYPIYRILNDETAAEILKYLEMTNFPSLGVDAEESKLTTSRVRVINDQSSVLRGSTLSNRDWIQDDSRLPGVEMDGIPLTETGYVDIELTGGFIPDELEIACEGWGYRGEPTHFGFCLKSRFKNGGYVWSNSSITWTHSLLNNNPSTTKNTLNAFGA